MSNQKNGESQSGQMHDIPQIPKPMKIESPTSTTLQSLLQSAQDSNIPLGVLLEIVQLANNDTDRASRILAIVAEDPPLQPLQFSTSSQERPDASTSTSVGADTASASAASNGNVAAVAVSGLSAGVAAVGTHGVSTSTAVPFSEVTTLPSGLSVTLNGSTGAKVVHKMPEGEIGLDANSADGTTDAVKNEVSVSRNHADEHGQVSTSPQMGDVVPGGSVESQKVMPLKDSIDLGEEIANRVMMSSRDYWKTGS